MVCKLVRRRIDPGAFQPASQRPRKLGKSGIRHSVVEGSTAQPFASGNRRYRAKPGASGAAIAATRRPRFGILYFPQTLKAFHSLKRASRMPQSLAQVYVQRQDGGQASFGSAAAAATNACPTFYVRPSVLCHAFSV